MMMLRLAPLVTTGVAVATTAGAGAKVSTTAAAIRWRNIALHLRMGLSGSEEMGCQLMSGEEYVTDQIIGEVVGYVMDI